MEKSDIFAQLHEQQNAEAAARNAEHEAQSQIDAYKALAYLAFSFVTENELNPDSQKSRRRQLYERSQFETIPRKSKPIKIGSDPVSGAEVTGKVVVDEIWVGQYSGGGTFSSWGVWGGYVPLHTAAKVEVIFSEANKGAAVSRFGCSIDPSVLFSDELPATCKVTALRGDVEKVFSAMALLQQES
jgi:hypothetical protein